MSDYTYEWEILATRNLEFTYTLLLKMYIARLKHCIHNDLKLLNPQYVDGAKSINEGQRQLVVIHKTNTMTIILLLIKGLKEGKQLLQLWSEVVSTFQDTNLQTSHYGFAK
jgi:hypothetical protein